MTGEGEAFDLVLFCEAGLIGSSPWLAARGRVAETRGHVYFVGTLWHDVGWYADLHERWSSPNMVGGKTFSIPSWSNRKIYPGGREDPEIEALEEEMDKWSFARRVGARLLPSPARIYPEFGDEHVEFIDRDSSAGIVVTIDPGYMPSRYSCLATIPRMDEHGREALDVYDEIWINNETHQEIIERLKAKPWWLQVVKLVMGHEAGQHAMATKSMEEIYREKTSGVEIVVCERHSDWDRINRVKTFLQDVVDKSLPPRIRVHPQCEGLIWEFQHWERPTDDDGKVADDQPEDENNDALDALGNLVLEEFGPVKRRSRDVGQAKSGEWWTPEKG